MTVSPMSMRWAAAHVDAQHSEASLTCNRVGLQAGAVGHIHDGDELARQNIGSIKEVLVDCHGADVVQVSMVTVARWILDLNMVRVMEEPVPIA